MYRAERCRLLHVSERGGTTLRQSSSPPGWEMLKEDKLCCILITLLPSLYEY